MESLVGITAKERYYLESLVTRSGLVSVYDAIDRQDDSRKVVELWDLELADQDDFLVRLHELAQIEDRRLVRIVDGGILVIPIGADILKEVPYIVTAPLAWELPERTLAELLNQESLTLDQVLTIGCKIADILHRLHSGAYIRSRSGQIIGQVKLCHGNLKLDNICFDPFSNRVILRDWYRFSLLEKQFLPQEDIKDLQTILTELIPHPPRSLVKVLQGEYTTAQALAESLRQCQVKPARHFYRWGIASLIPLALATGGVFLLSQNRQPSPEPVVEVPPPPPPIQIAPARPRVKFVPKPKPPREQQVYRIDFPTAPKPPELPPIPRSVRPAPPPAPLPPVVPPPPPSVPNPRVVIKPPATPLLPPSNDGESFKAIETTIDANFAPSYTGLVSQAGERALVTIAGEFTNPNRQAVSMLVLATKQGRTAPIFSARVTRSEWENDPNGTTWANFMTRSSSLLGFGDSSNSNRFRITIPTQGTSSPLVPGIQPARSAPTSQEQIEAEIQDRK